MSTRKTRKKNLDDEEIFVNDDIHTKRRKRGPKKETTQDVKTKDAVEKPDDLLAEFDLDGVTDEEREQIKMAVLASKEESFPKIQPDAISETDDVIRLDDDDDDDDTDDGSMPVENEDAGTQMSDEDILSETITNHAGEQEDPYCLPTQKDKTNGLGQQEYLVSTEEDEPDNMKMNEESVMRGQEVDHAEESNDEEEILLDFSRSTLNEDEEDFETQKPDSQTEETQDYETTASCSYVNDKRQKPLEKEDGNDRKNGEQQEICLSDPDQSNPESSSSPLSPLKLIRSQTSSQESTEANQGSSERSKSVDSQESRGFSPALKDAGSQETLFENDALQRHFRAVKVKPSRGPLYYCPVGMDVQKYAKVISQLFDIYNRKLKNAQRLYGGRLMWPEPVKPGQHHERSIDAKRRGHDVQFFDLSECDDNDDFKTESRDPKKSKRTCKESEMEDDLPELIVENANDHQIVPTKKTRFSAEEAAQIICNEELGSDHQTKISVISDDKRDGVNRGMANSRKAYKVPRLKDQPVIVADTQMDERDEEFRENAKRSKLDVVVEETQFCNEDEWLSVNKNTQTFEQLGQKKKLKGYTIPHKNVWTKPDIQQGKHHKADNESSNTKKPLGKRRKEVVQVLVEDTQDSDGEEVNLGTEVRKRARRNCFKIDSSSEDESIAESQEDKTEVREEVKQIKPQGFFAKIKSKVSNLISPIYAAKEETEDKENQSLKDGKTTRKLFSENLNKFDKTPVNKSRVRLKHDSECEPADVLFPANTNPTLKQKTTNTCKSFSRNTSKDSIVSNNSEEVSVASSQISTTLLNDNGDLYSTQFCEMRNENKPSKKRKAVSQLQEYETHGYRKGTENESDISEDEIVIIDGERKGSIPQNEKGGRNLPMNKKQRVNRKADSCVSKIERENKNVDKVSKLNQQLDNELEEHNLDDQGKYISEDEDPFPKTYSQRPLRDTRSRNTQKIVNSGIAINDDKFGKKSTTSVNLQKENNEAHCSQNGQNFQMVQSNNRTNMNKVSGWLVEQVDMAPVDLQNFSGPKNTVEDNKNMYDEQLDLTDSKQAQEVVSVDSDEIQIREDSPGEDNPTAGVSRDNEPMNMIECPLCGKEFSVQVIEEHAGTCEGPEPEGEAQTMQEDNNTTNGELETCWICEKQIPKAGSEKHVQECWTRAEQREQQQQNVKEEPIQTRRGKLRNAVTDTTELVTARRPIHRHKENTDRQ